MIWRSYYLSEQAIQQLSAYARSHGISNAEAMRQLLAPAVSPEVRAALKEAPAGAAQTWTRRAGGSAEPRRRTTWRLPPDVAAGVAAAAESRGWSASLLVDTIIRSSGRGASRCAGKS